MAGQDHFVWLHINMNHATAERWVRSQFDVDEDFFDEIHASSHRVRVARQDDALVGVLNDLIVEGSNVSAENATLWVWCKRGLIISARYKPVRMVEQLQARLALLELKSAQELLLHLLEAQETLLERLVRQTNQAVDAIEERLLSHNLKSNRSDLGQLHRMLLRFQRLLAPEPAALFRLLNRPPMWLERDEINELRQFTEEFSVILNDLVNLTDRIRLL